MATAGHGTDEAALIKRVAAGDTSAFRLIMDRHLGVIVAAARRVLNDEAEAEDVAQEAMLKLWSMAATLEVTEAGVRPWLRRVATNRSIDRIRSRARTTVTDEVPEVMTSPEQGRDLDQLDLSKRVGAAIAHLPERQRQAIALFHFDGLSQIEVGQALGVSDEAVESLLARARRALKAALKDEWRDLIPDEA